MINKLKRAYMNLKIRYKILLSLILVSSTTAIIISYSSYNYYVNYSLNQATYEIEKSIDIINKSLSVDISDLYFDISYLLTADNTLEEIVNDIRDADESNYINHYLDSQAIFDTTLRNNKLIKTVTLLGKNGEFYSTFSLGLNHHFDSANLFHEPDVKSITWDKIHQNPLTNENDYVIPIIFPIKKDYYNTYSFYLSDDEEAIANLYIFIDVNKLDRYLTQMNKNAASKIVLYNNEQNPISLHPSSEFYKLANNPSIIEYINNEESTNSIDLIINNQEYMITKSYFGVNGFTIVNFISKTQLLSPLTQLRNYVVKLFWLSIVMSIFLSFLVSKSITSPLKKLMLLVKDISEGNYRKSNLYNYNDEIGMLRNSLNTMSAIINKQIEVIKTQEKEYANAEIDILTQQINPHFLYNTLDYIRWEILGGNQTGSSNMVENLGEYLRLGLNRGSRTITIESEIKRIREYLSIINNRQNSNISLETIVQPDLLKHELLILILQPLIENCIKHAFDETVQLIVLDPTIRIFFFHHEDYITIYIEDNGKGMDVNKMYSIIQEKTCNPSPHVGIKNVYLRFKAYYGESSIMKFESTPFYRNVVTLSFKYVQQDRGL